MTSEQAQARIKALEEERERLKAALAKKEKAAVEARLRAIEKRQEASARAPLKVTPSGVTNLSPYAQLLDERMGLTKPKGVRNEGTCLILSAVGMRQDKGSALDLAAFVARAGV